MRRGNSGKNKGLGKWITDLCVQDRPGWKPLLFHCFAHQTALAVKKTADDVDYIKDTWDPTIWRIATWIGNSAVRRQQFQAAALALGLDADTVSEPALTRWLTRGKVAKSICRSLPAIIEAMRENSATCKGQQKAEVEGLLKEITSFRFQLTTFFMADALEPTTTLSQRQQTSAIAFNDHSTHIQDAIDKLNQMLESVEENCKHLASFLNDVKEGKATPYIRHLQEAKTEDDRDKALARFFLAFKTKIAEPYLRAAIHRLDDAYSSKMKYAFALFTIALHFCN